MSQLCYTIAECSAAIRVQKSKLYQLLAANELDSILVGRRRLILASSVEAFLSRKLAEANGATSNGAS